jgi:hypothetical protein
VPRVRGLLLCQETASRILDPLGEAPGCLFLANVPFQVCPRVLGRMTWALQGYLAESVGLPPGSILIDVDAKVVAGGLVLSVRGQVCVRQGVDGGLSTLWSALL